MNKKGLKILYFMVTLTFVLTVITIQGQYPDNKNSETIDDTEYWALLVAVAEYADNPNQNRPLMLQEVDDFYELLLTSPIWKEDHIKIIKTEDATVTNILKGLRWLDEKEDSNDMSLFYVTTHGFPLGYDLSIGIDLPPFDEADGADEAIASYWFFAYPTMFITDDEINFMLNRLESQGVCMIVDTCFAGGFNDSPNWNHQSMDILGQKQRDNFISKWIEGFGTEISGQGRVVLMASREDEVSYSGGFAPYLLDAMKGYGDENNDGIVTAEEAFSYTEPRAMRQHPTIFDNYPGEFPLITIGTSQTYDEKYVVNKNCIKMVEQSPNNQKVCGYITDSGQGTTIENATIQIISGDYRQGAWNMTSSDENGYYSFEVEPGEKRMFVEEMGYLRSIVDSFTVLENEIVWKNISLDRHPEENAVVCGFLTNSESGKPINDSQVFVEWGHHFEGYQNSTKTDESGFYKFSIASGEIGISFEHHNFIPKVTDEIEIEEGQKLWINDSLKPRPEENAILNGYVFDSTSDNRIANAQIYIEWKDTDGNQLTYRTSTNESGFFVIQLAPGESYITVSAADFEEKSLGRNDAIKDKTEWVNISLEPERIQLDITKPLNAIYLNDERIIPFPQCILIGTIEVEASVHDDWFRSMDDEVAKVEFYIDGELKETMESSPFTWNWNEKKVGRHSLKIIAYDKKGFSVQDDREVLLI